MISVNMLQVTFISFAKVGYLKNVSLTLAQKLNSNLQLNFILNTNYGVSLYKVWKPECRVANSLLQQLNVNAKS